jgi:hypothetical protein
VKIAEVAGLPPQSFQLHRSGSKPENLCCDKFPYDAHDTSLESTFEENSPLEDSYSLPTRKEIQERDFKKRFQSMGQPGWKGLDL